MNINDKIKAVDQQFLKWRLVVINEDWELFGKTEIEAISLREYFEGMRDGMFEALTFFNDPEFKKLHGITTGK